MPPPAGGTSWYPEGTGHPAVGGGPWLGAPTALDSKAAPQPEPHSWLACDHCAGPWGLGVLSPSPPFLPAVPHTPPQTTSRMLMGPGSLGRDEANWAPPCWQQLWPQPRGPISPHLSALGHPVRPPALHCACPTRAEHARQTWLLHCAWRGPSPGPPHCCLSCWEHGGLLPHLLGSLLRLGVRGPCGSLPCQPLTGAGSPQGPGPLRAVSAPSRSPTRPRGGLCTQQGFLPPPDPTGRGLESMVDTPSQFFHL